ncbi:GIY-YIG nuclease family protein [Patescibacteria group bacterium]|nr:GIY-YIG nuclease family protein [Patescibacteria group bacterium]MBU1256309.1 GIY-YIG nuclease family protein [Patescibacteria group bacterium]MBU1457749.1 GIY-YIG nuclease family protein [Patescibacteria group bacterium]
MYYVYVLKSLRDGKLYVGYSKNYKQRIKEHNKGRIIITKNRRPFILIYLEGYLNQQDATAREKFFKTGWGRTHLKKTLINYFMAA